VSSSFQVKGVLSLDGSRFSSGLSRAEIAASRFAHHVTSEIGGKLAGLFAVGALEEFSRRTVEAADKLVVAARRMGTTVEEVQVFKQVAKESNVELETLEKTFEKINIARAKALKGGPAGSNAMAAFNKMGLSEADLRNPANTVAAMFGGPMASFAKGRSVEDLGAIFRDMGLKDVGPIIQVLQSDIAGTSEELRKMGALISTEDAVALKQFKDALELGGQVLLAHWAGSLVRAGESLFAFIGRLSAGFAFLAEYAKEAAQGLRLMEVARKQGLDQFKTFLLGPFGLAGTKGLAQRSKQRLGEAAGIVLEQESGDVGDRAAMAFDRVDEKFKEMGEAIRKKTEEETYKIRHPKAPFYDTPEAVAKQTSKHFGKLDSDPLVAVGNFLGAGKTNSIQRIAEQQLDVQRKMLVALESIAQNGGTSEFE
jgi:hypothetical protein